MASLRNSPYFPLEVDAFVSDEKLNECSPSANGVYIRVLCLMHKSDEYGKIRSMVKGKDKIACFAEKLSKHLPFALQDIKAGLEELVNNGVLFIEDDCLCQKRMIKDGQLSEKRSAYGKIGMARRWAKNGRNKIESDELFVHEAQKKSSKKSEQAYTTNDFINDLMGLGVSKQTATDWMKNRQAKKLPPTRSAFEDTKKELLKNSEYTTEEQLKLAAVKGWGGYRFSWYLREIMNEENGNNNNGNGSSSSAKVQTATQPRDYDESFR